MTPQQTGSRVRRSLARAAAVMACLAALLVTGPASALGGAAEGRSGHTLHSDNSLREYRALRRMHARSDRLDQEGWLEAWTELDARGFRYQIVSERGSDAVRTKVLRAVLQREQELVMSGSRRAALTEENYEFSDSAPSPDGLWYVRMKPRRKDVALIDGRMVLDGERGRLLRIEGRLARNPSFWTSAVHVVRHFADVEGVRVPVALESVARVRLAGEATMHVDYEYESINGRPVSQAAARRNGRW